MVKQIDWIVLVKYEDMVELMYVLKILLVSNHIANLQITNSWMWQNPKNHGKKWTKEDVDLLKRLVKENTSTKKIASLLWRTEDAIRDKAKEEKISLKPTD